MWGMGRRGIWFCRLVEIRRSKDAGCDGMKMFIAGNKVSARADNSKDTPGITKLRPRKYADCLIILSCGHVSLAVFVVCFLEEWHVCSGAEFKGFPCLQ